MADRVKDPLVSEFFLMQNNAGVHQGRIVASLGDGHYLCQFFSWAFGERTHRQIVHITTMTTWELYDDADMWRAAGQQAIA